MKRIFTVLAITLSITFAGTTGCVKGDDVGPIGVAKIIPDLTNLVINVSRTFIKGAAAAIEIASTSMVDGTYDINYSLSGSNSFTGTATMNMSGGHGSFNTPVLANGGNTNVIINSITHSSGGSSNVTSNNTFNFFDSTGTMFCTAQIADAFYATDVDWTQTGTMLNIHGTMWEPELRTVNLTVYNFSVSSLPLTLNFQSLADGGAISYNSPGDLRTAAHGTIIITGINANNTMSGSYSATMTDSSAITGTFACSRHH